MHPNAGRVQEALAASGASGRVVELDDAARTAVEAADALGVELGQIVKSLVFAAGEVPILFLVAGDRRLDTASAAELAGVASLRRADPELVRRATGFPIGGVAPVGHTSSLATFIDASLERFSVLWAAAGTPHAVFPTSFAELEAITGAVSGAFTVE